MNLPSDYYHAFLGNGVDAVLIGPNGSMSPERINGPDRCYWYKADHYYPDAVPVMPSLDRRRLLGHDFRPKPGEPWYELAPLGRCWYEIGLPLKSSRQRFDCETAVLTTLADYPGVRIKATSFLHASAPILVERYEASAPVRFRFFCAPTVWSEEPGELNPARKIQAEPGAEPVFRYLLGDKPMVQSMRVEPAPRAWGLDGGALWVDVEGTEVVRYFTIAEAGQVPSRRTWTELSMTHQKAWRDHQARGARLEIADKNLAKVYSFTRYQLKAIQHPVNGALPVNNLRPTWSSHVFWDAGFMHLALLQQGQTALAERACAFLEGLRERAAQNARDCGAHGLKFEWEVTHDGTPAYGVHRHLTRQIHNNAMFALMCWNQYRYTLDRAVLQRFYPIIRGVAEFYFSADLRRVTGIAELAEPVGLDAATLAGAAASLRRAALAARLLGRDLALARSWQAKSLELGTILSGLIRGGVLRASDRGELSWGVLPACSLMESFAPQDPVLLRTARAYARANANPKHGIIGHGAEKRGGTEGFMWTAGWLAYTLASCGAGAEAWEILRKLGPGVSHLGGLSEKVFDDRTWNMQYFTTAQAAVCLALHALVAYSSNGTLRLSAPPWPSGEFSGLHLDGLSLSGSWKKSGQGAYVVRNVTSVPIEKLLVIGGEGRHLRLAPGEARREALDSAPHPPRPGEASDTAASAARRSSWRHPLAIPAAGSSRGAS